MTSLVQNEDFLMWRQIRWSMKSGIMSFADEISMKSFLRNVVSKSPIWRPCDENLNIGILMTCEYQGKTWSVIISRSPCTFTQHSSLGSTGHEASGLMDIYFSTEKKWVRAQATSWPLMMQWKSTVQMRLESRLQTLGMGLRMPTSRNQWRTKSFSDFTPSKNGVKKSSRMQILGLEI